jgi:hypothetical protein
MPLLRGRNLSQFRHRIGARPKFQPAHGRAQVMRVRWFKFLHRDFQLQFPSVATKALELGCWCLELLP